MSKVAVRDKNWTAIRQQAKKHLARIRELGRQRGWPKSDATQAQVIEDIRKVREKLWE
ncbi:MAG: hypothetical protein AAB091_07255 [Elusimicrobiota bacterium]